MTYLSTVLADNPRHYWRCADAGGGLLLDIGSAPMALSVNASTPISGYSGPNSLGGSAWLDANALAQFVDADPLAGPWTMEAFVWQHYRRASAQIIATAELAGGASVAVLQIGATGLPQGFGTATASTAGAAMSIQHWHHLAVVVTVAATTLYVDGVAQPAGGANGVGVQQITYGIGAHIQPFGGAASANISEVAFYNAALTGAQIAAHFAAADQLTALPAYQGFGVFSPGSGTTAFNPAQLDSILKSVRKTY
jgi:hypothetical protein